jgi:hypothetical protein
VNQAAPWEIGSNIKSKQPNFNKDHEHNLIKKTNNDNKPVGKTRQEVYNNRKAAQKEFNKYTNNATRGGVIGRNNVNVRRRGEYESASITTLDEDRFDPRTRDEIR